LVCVVGSLKAEGTAHGFDMGDASPKISGAGIDFAKKRRQKKDCTPLMHASRQ
jgi:hypothetical protein